MLAARLGTDEAGVHGKAVPAHQALVNAALHRHLEQPAKQVAVAEATVPVLRKVEWSGTALSSPRRQNHL